MMANNTKGRSSNNKKKKQKRAKANATTAGTGSAIFRALWGRAGPRA